MSRKRAAFSIARSSPIPTMSTRSLDGGRGRDRGYFFFVTDPAAAFFAAEAKLSKALSSVPDHARAHMWLGYVDIHTKRAAQGIAECEHALALDRNLATGHALIGVGKTFIGRAEERRLTLLRPCASVRAIRLAYVWMNTAGLAKLHRGSYEQAFAWCRRAIEANRNYPSAYFRLAVALAQLGRLGRAAHPAAHGGLALDPSFAISRARAAWAAVSDNPAYLAGLERVLEGMRKAGVPE